MSIQGTRNKPYTHTPTEFNMKTLGAQNIPNIPALPMIIVMFHTFFFILSLIAPRLVWTYAVIYMNVFFFILGMWASFDQNSAQAIFWMFLIHISSIVIDIIVLGLYFNTIYNFPYRSTYQFSAAMMIINLIFKPVTSFVLVYLYWFRDGFGKVLATLKPTTREDNPYSTLEDGERS